MNTEPMESIIYGSRYSAGRLSLANRWIRAIEDPDIRAVRDPLPEASALSVK
jgi:hypothetical protein